MRTRRKSEFSAAFPCTGSYGDIMKLRRNDSSIISGAPKRRVRIPFFRLILGALVVLVLVWAWQRGGEQPQHPVEKAIPAAKLGQ